MINYELRHDEGILELQSKVVYGQIQHNELRWWRFL